MAEPASLVGTLIDGRYRVEQLVGSGGFGTVYSATHLGLGSKVALKVLQLPKQIRSDQLTKLASSFYAEARTLKRLRHPNIVAALDLGLLEMPEHATPLPYLVMEWCSGPTLQKLLADRNEQPMSLDEAWKLFEPLLEAMAHAHAAGVAHRDLKPANIVLEPAQTGGALEPRVIDFGIAKIVAPEELAGSGSTGTSSGSSPFTPRYAAPEQLAGARTGPWTDVHALALVFVELVTGRPAIGSDGDAPLAGIDPVRPTPKTRGVHVGALEDVLARALALRPSERYADAGELARAMAELAGRGWPDALGSTTAPATEPGPSRTRPVAPVGDRTAPPSSHTLRTTSGARAMPQAAPRRRAWLLPLAASMLALAMIGGLGTAALRWRGAWPFRTRVRDLSTAEIERRVQAAGGLGRCIPSESADLGRFVSCEQGNVWLIPTHLPATTTREGADEHLANMARGMSNTGRAAKYALDGGMALFVVGPADRVAVLFDAVLGNATFEMRGDAAPAPAPRTERSSEARTALAAWTGADLVAAVKEAGLTVKYSDPAGFTPIAVIYEQERSASVMLQTGDPRAKLDNWKKQPMVTAFAIDGDNLLVVSGDPVLPSEEMVKRVLGGARAAEIGVHRP